MVKFPCSNSPITQASDRITISNSADFQWASEITHPRSRPLSARVYIIEKLFLPVNKLSPTALTVPSVDAIDELKDFSKSYNGRLDIWLYPTKEEYKDESIWKKAMSQYID